MNAPAQNEYLLLITGTAWYNRKSLEELQESLNQFQGWFQQMSENGKLKGAQPLAREGAVVTKKGIVSDGPFAESKEVIGGYFLLQVDTLEEAIAIAKSCPALEYAEQIEVRPVAQECPLAARLRQLAPEEQLATA